MNNSSEINRKHNLCCQRCSHEWLYTGQNPYFTLCPHCRTTVRIRKKQDRKVVQSAQVGAHVQTE